MMRDRKRRQLAKGFEAGPSNQAGEMSVEEKNAQLILYENAR